MSQLNNQRKNNVLKRTLFFLLLQFLNLPRIMNGVLLLLEKQLHQAPMYQQALKNTF